MCASEKDAFIPEHELNSILSAVDIDGNGVIDYDEFLAATMNLQGKAMVKVSLLEYIPTFNRSSLVE